MEKTENFRMRRYSKTTATNIYAAHGLRLRAEHFRENDLEFQMLNYFCWTFILYWITRMLHDTVYTRLPDWHLKLLILYFVVKYCFDL